MIRVFIFSVIFSLQLCKSPLLSLSLHTSRLELLAKVLGSTSKSQFCMPITAGKDNCLGLVLT